MRDRIERSASSVEVIPAKDLILPRRWVVSGALAACGVVASGSPHGTLAAGSATPTPPAASNDEVGTVWWVELVTNDETKAAEFYETAIGWKSNAAVGGKQPASADAGYTLFSMNGSEVAGALRADTTATAKNKPMWIVYFQVDSVDKAIARTLAKGGLLLVPPYEVAGSARMALLSDIDGIAFGVATPI